MVLETYQSENIAASIFALISIIRRNASMLLYTWIGWYLYKVNLYNEASIFPEKGQKNESKWLKLWTQRTNLYQGRCIQAQIFTY